jgi:hypothetical protein
MQQAGRSEHVGAPRLRWHVDTSVVAGAAELNFPSTARVGEIPTQRRRPCWIRTRIGKAA